LLLALTLALLPTAAPEYTALFSGILPHILTAEGAEGAALWPTHRSPGSRACRPPSRAPPPSGAFCWWTSAKST